MSNNVVLVPLLLTLNALNKARTQFYTNFLFPYLLKPFSGGIEIEEHWADMDQLN